MIGGQVRGGVVHGHFPEVRPDGPNSITSNGVMLPTSPWEVVWRPLAQWLGARDEQMSRILPNHDRFPDGQLPALSQVFRDREPYDTSGS